MILPTLDLETQLWTKGLSVVCGVDEVGRGCFAGPVVVGAVSFSPKVILPDGIADSKLIPSKKREILSEVIKKIALGWAVEEVDVATINKVGIGAATQIAFRSVLSKIGDLDFVLIDAFHIRDFDRSRQKAVVEGDSICASIAAASIVAKVYRDQRMVELDSQYPQYGFAKHKGYGTREHQAAIKKYGLCDLHRRSFNLIPFLTSST